MSEQINEFNPKTMKICKTCGKAIAKNAKSCPYCGGKNKKPIYKRKLFILIVVLVVIGAVAGAFGGGDDSDKAAGADADKKIEYTAYDVGELDADLDKNPVNAAEKYKDQYVELSGKLNVIDSDGSYISITNPNDEWDLVGVQCYIKSDEQLDKVKKLSIGDVITVKGKITDVGEVLGYSLDIDEIN